MKQEEERGRKASSDSEESMGRRGEGMLLCQQ